MRFTAFHIVLAVLLALVCCAEPVLACVDAPAAARESYACCDEEHEQEAASDERHDDGCDDCSSTCACHAPAILIEATSIDLPDTIGPRHIATDIYLLSSSTSPPDHVPLV